MGSKSPNASPPTGSQSQSGTSHFVPTRPPLAPVDSVAPLTAVARSALAAALRQAWEAAQSYVAKHPEYLDGPPPLTDEDIAAAVGFLEGTTRADAKTLAASLNAHFLAEPAAALAARADIGLVHLVRLAALTGSQNDHGFRQQLRQLASRHYFAREPRFSLRDLAAALKAAGRDEEEIALATLSWPWLGDAFLRFNPDDVWPYFADHAEVLQQTWHTKSASALQDDCTRKIIVKILALFPTLPLEIVRLCWDIAFNGTKKDRPLAQAALAKEPGAAERIVAALTGGKAEHRAIAADWLARLGCQPAIPALKKALAKEKKDQAAGAMMLALETLGVPLEEFVSPNGLLKEAQALRDKGVPQELAWFNFDKIPGVRWAKENKPVAREILEWMIVQGHKLGAPEPGPKLRQYTAHFNRGDAEHFGQFVLEAWIGQDTISPSAEQAHQEAEQLAARFSAMSGSLAKYAPAGGPTSKEEWYRVLYNAALARPVGTAIKQKGVLAVAGACCGGRAAPVVERYLKNYYGMRVHQCRALVRMLAWIDHPSAIQLLLSVSNRFRTAGIRQEAESCVNELAERKSWTIAELADRTVPTAGLEEQGVLVLDFGPRQFTARLDGELKLILHDEKGGAIKSLPEPRQSDDAEKAKAAKKALSAAKKEIESVLKMQKERLYGAMCTERMWSFDDWDRFLNKHPIVRHYCQRLVWCTRGEGKVTQTFRPLEDGTLTDTSDEPMIVAADAQVCIAHPSFLSAEWVNGWQQHLADYEVQPLFDQLGKQGYHVPEGKGHETSVADFRGFLLDAFKLRGRLTKLGYTRGAAEEGGWFRQYHKHFPSLGITATIEFTGNRLPEENRTVALTALYFARTADGKDSPDEGTQWRFALGEVPRVLLSECWNDARAAAAEGPGFDPQWQKKTEG